MAEPIITITDLATEKIFTDYFNRRAGLRSRIANGVLPNLVAFLADYDAFLADYGPDNKASSEQVWAYYKEQTKPVAAAEDQLIGMARAIVAGLTAIEQAAPGTFGIAVPVVQAVEPEPAPELTPRGASKRTSS